MNARESLIASLRSIAASIVDVRTQEGKCLLEAADEIERLERIEAAGCASLLANRAVVEKAIAGALKSAIDAHGPVTVENRSSAAKRIYSALKRVARDDRVAPGRRSVPSSGASAEGNEAEPGATR